MKQVYIIETTFFLDRSNLMLLTKLHMENVVTPARPTAVLAATTSTMKHPILDVVARAPRSFSLSGHGLRPHW